MGVMAIVFKFVREKAGLGDELCGVSGVSMVWAVWIRYISWVLGSNRFGVHGVLKGCA